jgi:hypothetical protein
MVQWNILLLVTAINLQQPWIEDVAFGHILIHATGQNS